jgi:hypothetical protein
MNDKIGTVTISTTEYKQLLQASEEAIKFINKEKDRLQKGIDKLINDTTKFNEDKYNYIQNEEFYIKDYGYLKISNLKVVIDSNKNLVQELSKYKRYYNKLLDLISYYNNKSWFQKIKLEKGVHYE